MAHFNNFGCYLIEVNLDDQSLFRLVLARQRDLCFIGLIGDFQTARIALVDALRVAFAVYGTFRHLRDSCSTKRPVYETVRWWWSSGFQRMPTEAVQLVSVKWSWNRSRGSVIPWVCVWVFGQVALGRPIDMYSYVAIVMPTPWRGRALNAIFIICNHAVATA